MGGQQRGGCKNLADPGDRYGDTAGNIGNSTGNDFWTAARLIVEQVYRVLAPGAHACWVVKAYVKNKAIVPFPEQWQALCEAVGFQTLHYHCCWLVEDKGNARALMDFTTRKDNGEEMVIKTGDVVRYISKSKIVERFLKRSSFFRKLAEKKGSPRSDFEVVLCMIKPGNDAGMACVSSPSFSQSSPDGGWQLLGKYAEH
jgi:hypothetical protein